MQNSYSWSWPLDSFLPVLRVSDVLLVVLTVCMAKVLPLCYISSYPRNGVLRPVMLEGYQKSSQQFSRTTRTNLIVCRGLWIAKDTLALVHNKLWVIISAPLCKFSLLCKLKWESMLLLMWIVIISFIGIWIYIYFFFGNLDILSKRYYVSCTELFFFWGGPCAWCTVLRDYSSFCAQESFLGDRPG